VTLRAPPLADDARKGKSGESPASTKICTALQIRHPQKTSGIYQHSNNVAKQYIYKSQVINATII
jgi:hypothetical protein